MPNNAGLSRALIYEMASLGFVIIYRFISRGAGFGPVKKWFDPPGDGSTSP